MAWTAQANNPREDSNDHRALLARRDILAGMGAVGMLAVAGSVLVTASPAHAEPGGAGSVRETAPAPSAKADVPVETKAAGRETPAATDISAQRYYRRRYWRVRRRYYRRRRRWWRRGRYWY
jgi:hypothetical protein